MDQTNQPPPNRRRFFGLLSAMGYVAPAVISLGVPAAGPDDARGTEPQKGGMGGMGMSVMGMRMMKMRMSGMMRRSIMR